MCTFKPIKDIGQMKYIMCFIPWLMLTLKAVLDSQPVIKIPVRHDRYVIFRSIISLAR